MSNTSNEYYDIVGEYWDKYIGDNLKIPDRLDTIRPEILASWKRSLSYGVSPFGVRNTTLPPEKLDKLLRENRMLISIAHDHLRKLYLYVKGTDFALALVNHDGYVMDILADDELIHKKACSSGLTLGCLRSEKAVGTSGIAICLTLGTPYAVHGKEHFIQPHHDYICCGAPIYSPDKELLGCLALIGPYKLAPAHSLGMITAAADGVEKELKLRLTYDQISEINTKFQFTLDSLSSSVLLVDRAGRITQANKITKDILGINKNPLHMSIHELLTDSYLVNSLLKSNTNISNKEVFVNDSQGTAHTVIMSVIYSTVATDDIVFKFDRVKSIHKLVNKISGFTAKYSFDSIIGSSPCMESVKSLGRLAAKNDTNLLILGESGTGKDVLAQAVHNASHRCSGPFIAINCAALPKGLIESELFGYETGAFTGANKSGNPGKFELADGGTLFLDEIGDMPLDIQATLLRVIQNKEIIRIGGKKPKSIDVRIIAATNSDLETAVENKLFRSDLYYRLNVLSIKIPPLRQRLEDIPALIDHFIKLHGTNGSYEMFTPEIRYNFENHTYPGNVRELENMVERVLITADDDTLRIQDLFEMWKPELKNTDIGSNISHQELPEPDTGSKDTKTDLSVISPVINSPKMEYQRIKLALQQEKGHVPSAAIRLDMPKRTLYRKIQKYNIELDEFRQW